MTSHGGKRKGAGRKPAPDAKVNLPIRVPLDVRAFLESTGNMSQTVTDAVRRSRAYRDWNHHNPLTRLAKP